jgi:hypothetical protein
MDESGVGQAESFGYDVIEVGAGDVQVSISWNADSDVDLHVVDPYGDEIYYGNTRVSSGGVLDLDSNASCRIDGIRNENITWPEGEAPRGTYVVRVDYWDSCEVPATDYVVRMSYGGQQEVVSGTFTGGGDQGVAGSGVYVNTFRLWSNPTYVEGVTRSPIGEIRGQDSRGCGLFGSSRDGGARRHAGVDYTAAPGQSVFAVIDGVVSKIGYPYADDLSYRYIEITSQDRHPGGKSYVVRQFYVNPGVELGANVEAREAIGTYQELGSKYPGVTEHVHVEMRYDGVLVDPTELIPYPGTLPTCS